MAFKKSNQAANDTRNSEEKPKTKVWLNIGYRSEEIDPNTGEKMIVTLPYGIGVDTMNTQKEPNGKNEAFAQLVAAKNDFLEQLQRFAETLEPGQEEILDDLVIQIRRVEEATQSETTDGNPHRSALSRLSFVSKAA